MQTAINWEKLKALPTRQQQLQALAGAVDFEFKKVALALDMAPHAAIAHKLYGTAQKAATPNFERIKGFMAQKYDTPSDNPILTDVSNEMEQFFHTNMPEMDMAFSVLFDLVDLRNSMHDHFDIVGTNAGITFSQREPGEEVKIRRNVTEDKTTVSMLEFADGIGLLDRWLDYQMFWNIDEAIAEFRAKYYDKMAATHYALFTAQGAGINTAFSTDDTTTANTAAATIIRNCKSAGYALGDNPAFYAVCAPEKVGRLEKMLTAQRGSVIVDQGTVSQPLAYRINGVIGTTHVAAADTGWYLVLPGRKIKRGVWLDLSTEEVRNAYVSATDIVAKGRYNGAVGDSNQVRRCLYA